MSKAIFASSSDNVTNSMKLPESWLKATSDSDQQQVMNHDKGNAGVHLDPQANPTFDNPTPTKATMVSARIDMSAGVAGAGLCPECRKPMKASNVSGIPSLVCAADRISLPMPDAGQ